MYRRRSRLEIILTILTNIRNGMNKPTRIMYAANMSWKPVQKILSTLIEQGLIEMKMNPNSRQSRKRYMIKEKGITLLDYFDKANEIVPLEVLNAVN